MKKIVNFFNVILFLAHLCSCSSNTDNSNSAPPVSKAVAQQITYIYVTPGNGLPDVSYNERIVISGNLMTVARDGGVNVNSGTWIFDLKQTEVTDINKLLSLASKPEVMDQLYDDIHFDGGDESLRIGNLKTFNVGIFTDTSGTTQRHAFPLAANNLVGYLVQLMNSNCGDKYKVQMGGGLQGRPLEIPQTVSTVAGTLKDSGSADGSGGIAKFNFPFGITTDGNNLFVADRDSHTIRKVVIATNEVTTIAGSSGSFGWVDGIGSGARFNTPMGITTDGINLFVADTYNHTIRKVVIATGVVTTLAGSAAEWGTTDGVGTAARFTQPRGITTDGNSIYVADTTNNTIRKIAINTGVVTTLAGSPNGGSTDGAGATASFNSPGGITTDGKTLFIVDTFNHTIRKLVISTGVVTTLAGSPSSQGSADGTGLNASFSYPGGIATDGTNLFVADSFNSTIRKIVIASGVVTTIAGDPWDHSGNAVDGTTTTARFATPEGITSDGADLYVADTGFQAIRKIISSRPAPVIGTKDSYAPGYIIYFKSGVETQAETTRLAAKYGFQPTHVYDALGGFSADFPTTTLERIRYETTIKDIYYNQAATTN